MSKSTCEKGGKHEIALPDNIIDRIGGRIYCPKCGMVGYVSNGRRKIGRPARIFWDTTSTRHEVSP